MTAPEYASLCYALLAAGLALMAIGAVCLLIGRAQRRKREAWLRLWNITELRSRGRAI